MATRFTVWRRRYIRPVWVAQMAWRWASDLIDIQDVLHVVGIVMVAFGAERTFGAGFGLLAAGSLLLVPSMVAILRKGSTQ